MLPAQVTDDISGYSFADVFSSVGKKTDVIVRFSIVTGPSGSPEWLRDPRGFAIKFYTKQGNWDLVSLCWILPGPCTTTVLMGIDFPSET